MNDKCTSKYKRTELLRYLISDVTVKCIKNLNCFNSLEDPDNSTQGFAKYVQQLFIAHKYFSSCIPKCASLTRCYLVNAFLGQPLDRL